MKKSLPTIALLAFLFPLHIHAQKIDIDSLLITTIKLFNKNNDAKQGLQKARLGKKLAPDYLDFHLLMGKIFITTKQTDSASYYFNYVITKNSNYQEAFVYLINIQLQEKKYSDAATTIEKAMAKYPDEKIFYQKKIVLFQLQANEKEEYALLKTAKQKFPDDATIKQQILLLETKNKSDRLGLNYSYTHFSRDDYGPWHLGTLQYIRERKWGSIIGRVNYANRLSFQRTIADGIQLEADSYLYHNTKTYSFITGSYSPDLVFPKLRLGYSLFHNYKAGWESELGFRYTKAADRDFKTALLGMGKYIGAYWINFKMFVQNEKSDYYPAFSLTTRYYFDTRFDYLTVIVGYGTSPDERATIGQFQDRIALNSYRFGTGYYSIFKNKYITGIQATYNRQEYVPNLMQNEIEIGLVLQYKF